jgi:translation initiation factor IF-1
MRVDASQVLAQGGLKIKSGTGSATDSLKKGDVVRATVVSSDKNGVISLKMESGQSFTAKLGTDVKLSPGDVILLEVSDKDNEQVSLTYRGVENADDDLSLGQKQLVRDFSDKSLATYASKLAELNMPVTEESARLMRELITQNPGLTLDEAAFLASNKIVGDQSLMRAALEILAGGDKTDAMLEKILSLLGKQDPLVNPEVVKTDSLLNNTAPSGGNTPTPSIPSGEQGLPTINSANAAPLTELLTHIVKNSSGLFQAVEQGEATPESATKTIITQHNSNMQINDENIGNLTKIPQVAQGNGSVMSQTQIQGDGSVVSQNQGQIQVTQGDGSVVSQTGNAPLQDTTQVAQNPQAQSTTAPQTGQSMRSVVAELLSEIPEFKGTQPAVLERFSETLIRVASDTALDNLEAAKDTEKLAAQLDKLFTRIGRDDSDAGARLREAREELFARLALIEETISRASQPVRADLLQQTQKLMDHVRLLNSINQFVYMQLPVQLNDDRKAAELYVFKRKGSKRADPDNVNILLSIDLENMGHWEALLNIKGKDVSINMEVPGEAEKKHFSENTVLLHEMLSEDGFKLVSTSIKLFEKETTPLTALSSLDRYTGGKQSMIDFMI